MFVRHTRAHNSGMSEASLKQEKRQTRHLISALFTAANTLTYNCRHWRSLSSAGGWRAHTTDLLTSIGPFDHCCDCVHRIQPGRRRRRQLVLLILGAAERGRTRPTARGCLQSRRLEAWIGLSRRVVRCFHG